MWDWISRPGFCLTRTLMMQVLDLTPYPVLQQIAPWPGTECFLQQIARHAAEGVEPSPHASTPAL